jgi:hypothetical protein
MDKKDQIINEYLIGGMSLSEIAFHKKVNLWTLKTSCK